MQYKISEHCIRRLDSSRIWAYKIKGVAPKSHPEWCRTSDQIYQLSFHSTDLIVLNIS
jgi:hypothetical protein